MFRLLHKNIQDLEKKELIKIASDVNHLSLTLNDLNEILTPIFRGEHEKELADPLYGKSINRNIKYYLKSFLKELRGLDQEAKELIITELKREAEK